MHFFVLLLVTIHTFWFFVHLVSVKKTPETETKKENCSFCCWQGKYLIMYYLLYTSCAIYITLCIVLKIINIDNLYLTGCLVLFIPHVIGCHTKYVGDLSNLFSDLQVECFCELFIESKPFYMLDMEQCIAHLCNLRLTDCIEYPERAREQIPLS